MNNPRDFIPAKYQKNQTDKAEDFVSDSVDPITNLNNPHETSQNESNSPWSDLAKEPEIPEYRSNSTLDEETPEEDSAATSSLNSTPAAAPADQKTTFSPKKKSNNKLAGLLVVFFLVIGVFASYLLSKQNQDLRQQASTSCSSDDPYCECAYDGSELRCHTVEEGSSCNQGDSNCKCEYDDAELRCRIDYSYNTTPDDICSTGYHSINGHCIPDNCQDPDGDGQYVCGYTSDGDPCTEDSMGGDWCTNTAGQSVTCASLGMIRCQCSPGSDTGYWVIGIADSCSELCDEAAIDCSDCDEPPGEPPGETDPTPTPTPTPVPQPLACGEFGCNTNSDCNSGLTCQAVTASGRSQKICALGSNQLFCAASPGVASCCEAQAMPVCANIDMLDSDNNLMEGDDDANLEIGDEIRFRCSAVGNQNVDFNYEFRIWNVGSAQWIDLTDESGTVAKNISDSYTIASLGDYIAQGRICWGSECQVWETVAGAPQVVNCETDAECATGETCYQPPMPVCPTGVSCVQVLPDKYCK